MKRPPWMAEVPVLQEQKLAFPVRSTSAFMPPTVPQGEWTDRPSATVAHCSVCAGKLLARPAVESTVGEPAYDGLRATIF